MSTAFSRSWRSLPVRPSLRISDFKKMCGIVWCLQGSLEEANKLLEPVRRFRRPAFEFFAPLPFPAVQSLFDALYGSGLQWYWKADFFKEVNAA